MIRNKVYCLEPGEVGPLCYLCSTRVIGWRASWCVVRAWTSTEEKMVRSSGKGRNVDGLTT